jgi:hypothetical protein
MYRHGVYQYRDICFHPGGPGHPRGIPDAGAAAAAVTGAAENLNPATRPSHPDSAEPETLPV